MSEIGDSLSQKGFQIHLPEKAESGVDWFATDIDEAAGTKRQFIDKHLTVLTLVFGILVIAGFVAVKYMAKSGEGTGGNDVVNADS